MYRCIHKKSVLAKENYLHHLSEQSELTISLAENEKKLAELQKTQVDMRMLYSGLREFTEVKKLTPMLVNKLIQRIEIHNNEKSSGYCFVQVDIYFTAVGLCNLQTAEEIAKLLEEAKAEHNSLKPAEKERAQPPKGGCTQSFQKTFFIASG